MEELASRYENSEFLDKTAIRNICFGDILSGRDSLADAIVDGPFIKRQKDLSLKWRGSSNQRIWIKDNGKLSVCE